jgi:hypothetical protein
VGSVTRLLSSRTAHDRVEQSPWLHEEFVQCYAHWREESAAVRLSYEDWRDAEPDVESLAYAVHVAALDREERAADVYRECSDRINARA